MRPNQVSSTQHQKSMQSGLGVEVAEAAEATGVEVAEIVEIVVVNRILQLQRRELEVPSTKAQNILTFQLETGLGAACITNTDVQLTFVLNLEPVLGRTCSSRNLQIDKQACPTTHNL